MTSTANDLREYLTTSMLHQLQVLNDGAALPTSFVVLRDHLALAAVSAEWLLNPDEVSSLAAIDDLVSGLTGDAVMLTGDYPLPTPVPASSSEAALKPLRVLSGYGLLASGDGLMTHLVYRPDANGQVSVDKTTIKEAEEQLNELLPPGDHEGLATPLQSPLMTTVVAARARTRPNRHLINSAITRLQALGAHVEYPVA